MLFGPINLYIISCLSHLILHILAHTSDDKEFCKHGGLSRFFFSEDASFYQNAFFFSVFTHPPYNFTTQVVTLFRKPSLTAQAEDIKASLICYSGILHAILLLHLSERLIHYFLTQKSFYGFMGPWGTETLFSFIPITHYLFSLLILCC